MTSSITLWTDFLQSFTKNIANADRQTLERLKTLNQRKYFFKTDLLPKIADDLKLFYDDTKEFLRVDYTFFKEGSLHKWKVPMIFIESENSWESSYEEAMKLCSLNAPLKILILYGLTDKLRGELEDRESNWDYIFEDYIEEAGLVGHFVLLVYVNQDDKSIKFKKMIYDDKGDRVNGDDNDLIIELKNSR